MDADIEGDHMTVTRKGPAGVSEDGVVCGEVIGVKVKARRLFVTKELGLC